MPTKRMFLPVMLLALLLAGAAVHRSAAKVGRWLSFAAVAAGAALIAVLVHDRDHVAQAAGVAVGVAALWLGARALPYARWVAVALTVGCVALLGGTLRAQQKQFDKENRGWLDGALKDMPAGSRIAAPNIFSYYALFGPRFELDPFRVDEDSQPYPMLHVEWKQNPRYSWKYEFGAKWKPAMKSAYEGNTPKVGWRAIEDKTERKLARDRAIVDGLRKSGADYIAVASYDYASKLHGAKPKERTRPFAPIVDLLDASSDFKRVRIKKNVMIYKRVK